jgi:signal transduction histidine kinase/ketosteroid isomerase-like protein
MKLTKKQETEILQTHDAYWAGYINGDVKGVASLLDDQYTQVGSAETEVFFNKKAAVKFLRDTIDQVTGKLDMRNRTTRLEPLNGLVLVHELCDLYARADKKWIWYSKFRASSLLQKKENKWKIVHQHSSMPDARTGEGDNIAIQKIEEENQQLREAVKRRTVELEHKTRELEMEAALERVRAVAMSMRKPDDLTRICEVLFAELVTLGFTELRNTMINVYDDANASFLNYDFSGEKGKSITFFKNNSHPVIENFIKQVRKTRTAFAPFSLSGKKLRDFIRFREWNGEKTDRKLRKATAIHYYFYSIGKGSIGISTLKTIRDEQVKTLKRFRNVFEVAYQRYVDITLAEEQARRVQIDLALERVRARTMAMQKSEELAAVAEVLRKEMGALGVEELETSSIYIVDDRAEMSECWYAIKDIRSKNKKLVTDHMTLRLEETWVGRQMKKFQRSKQTRTSILMRGENRKEWINYCAEKSSVLQGYYGGEIPERTYHLIKFSNGFMGAASPGKISVESWDLLQRATSVFSFAYKRFSDLQKAEAQAREAQIQLALERVRARTMAMQKSEELPEAANLLFQQVQSLGMPAWSAGYCIWNEDKSSVTLWMSSEGVLQPPFTAPTTEDELFIEMRKGSEHGITLHIVEMGGTKLVKHYRYMRTLPVVGNILDSIIEAGHPLPTFQIMHQAYFSKGFLLFITYEPVPDAHDIFKRFASVFEQTYTRFLDLQKAEAQAREAQIEAALERVRSSAMAMHSSEGILEVTQVLREQIAMLGEKELESILIHIYHEDTDQFEAWYSYRHPESIEKLVRNGKQMLSWSQTARARKDKEKYHEDASDYCIVADYKMLKEWYEYLLEIIPEVVEVNADGTPLVPDVLYYNYSKIAGGTLLLITNSEASDHSKYLLRRAAIVFNLAYSRFLDLQKAEAQARESQIQLALERVRARTMAMHHSSELADTATILFQQIKELGFEIWSCGFGIWKPEVDMEEAWMSTGDLFPIIMVPFREDPTHLSIYEASQRGESVFEAEVKGEVLTTHYDWLMSLPSFKIVFGQIENSGIILPTVQYKYAAFFKQGYLHLITTKPQPDIHNINQRFAKVFEQTYTRFLDLQKAEAQARESQIQLALERVRARTMAMHKSEELTEVAVMLYKELLSLGVTQEFFECGYVEIDEANKIQRGWMTGPDGNLLEPFNLPLTGEPIFDSRYEAWKQQIPVFHQVVAGDQLKRHIEFAIPYFDSKEVEEIARTQVPDSIVFYCGNFSHGYLAINCGLLLDAEGESLIARFTRVFEMTYLRFLDLKKAEAQAREAQIEAALERVRSRSMGMQKSEELKEVIQIVVEQFVQLKIQVEHAGFIMDYKERDDMHIWLADPHKVPSELTIPYFDSPHWNSFMEAKKQGLDFFANHLSFEVKNRFYRDLFTLFPVPEEAKDYYLTCPGLAISTVLLDNIGLYIENFSGTPYNEEENKILMRFGKVFQQTYTRFLDLQKAEAQAREAQIEAALERIRSRTMAMQRSDELAEAAQLLYQQFHSLGIKTYTCAYMFIEEEKNLQRGWTVSSDGKLLPNFFDFPLTGDSILDQRFQSWKNKLSIHEAELLGEANRQHHEFLVSLQPREFAEYIVANLPDKVFFYNANFQYGYLFIVNTEPFTAEEKDIAIRFTKVFEQTYIRFLDLQKAEAQAREAQIEAALERVRAKTMAMHNSHDVGESVAALFDELTSLGVLTSQDRCGIGIMLPNEMMELWTAEKNVNKIELTIGHLNMQQHQLLKNVYQNWLDKKESYQYILEGDDKLKYYDAIRNQKNYKIKKDYYSAYAKIVHTDFYFNEGCLYVFSLKEFTSEESNIFMRFVNVFGQTYRRYLDLQKAEAQTREAQIEAALERVRSRAMAMQSSDDLNALIGQILSECTKLGLELDRCIVLLVNPQSLDTQWILANPELPEQPSSYLVKYHEHPPYLKYLEAWRNRVEKWQYILGGNEKQEWDDFIFTNTELTNLPLPAKEAMRSIDAILLNASFGTFGNLTFSSFDPLTDDQFDLLVRFAKVLDLTYTRFNDLKQAEARAKEAVKQASLDRVRAEIASMRTKQDLERITPLIWKELTTLGIPFVRCGVFIMDEQEELIHTFLSTPDGKAIAAFHVPYDSTPLAGAIEFWREKKIYVTHWGLKEYGEFADAFIDKHEIEKRSHYLNSVPKEGIHLHLLPFMQGMLYVGNTTPLTEDNLPLLQSVADAFSTAYARYEDFNKLEAAKKQVDSTLNELQVTQKQLIQSEKMASLGELTAGIAHEIQNPLNFVNNFSEVSTELVAEMYDEIIKGNTDEAKEIANDLKQNLDKINHHGKRAADIVKGMLQHSRSSSGVKELTDINALADEYLRLAYHGLRAKDKSFNAKFETHLDPALPKLNVIPQDFGRVILNLINNAFYAVSEKSKVESVKSGTGYEPKVIVTTRNNSDKIEISVNDNGNGIPEAIKEKIFQPFFTTKPTGQGTGLGLSLSYDIVKAHGGELKVKSTENLGTEFLIILPS